MLEHAPIVVKLTMIILASLHVRPGDLYVHIIHISDFEPSYTLLSSTVQALQHDLSGLESPEAFKYTAETCVANLSYEYRRVPSL